jgi:hypothetical protein
MRAASKDNSLKSMERTFVHKSIEKTQKFKYFWVFSGLVCSMQKLFLASAPEGF